MQIWISLHPFLKSFGQGIEDPLLMIQLSVNARLSVDFACWFGEEEAPFVP